MIRMKPKPLTFRPDEKVNKELRDAKSRGYNLTWLVNEALRKFFKLKSK